MLDNTFISQDTPDLKELDETLRPRFFREFVGQEETKKIKIFVEAAKKRGDVLEHFLFYGPPGLGKTTLAHILANEMGKSLKTITGPSISKVGDLTAVLTNLSEGDFLFIDEIHRLPSAVEEVLYSAMEDYALDIVLGKGPSARTARIDLQPFTLVGATTKAGLLTKPLRDRFGSIHKLKFYSNKALAIIVKRSAKILNVPIQEEAALEIAKRSRGTPRIANRLLKRVRDISQFNKENTITVNSVYKACEILNIDSEGLDNEDRHYLRVILNDFEGGPVGLSTLCASLSEDKTTIEEVIEPLLIKKGFLKRTPSGRVITQKGRDHLAKFK